MISALPVSGAAQPNTIGAHCDRPSSSFSSAELDLAVALTAELGLEVARPEVLVAHLVLELVDDRASGSSGRRTTLTIEHGRAARSLADERVDPVELLLELGLGREIPRHQSPPGTRCNPWSGPGTGRAASVAAALRGGRRGFGAPREPVR